MASATFDIYMLGVGGQGIGLLSEALLRAFDHAGTQVRGVDTHGLAQRGGTVISHLRVGPDTHSPLVREGSADLVIALERHEALRGLQTHLRPGGQLVYYDAEWQPLPVRLGQAPRVTPEILATAAQERRARLHRVFVEDLPDPRQQNVAVMAWLIRHGVLPGLTARHLEAALADLLEGPTLARNLELFSRLVGAGPDSPP
ncbi:MAG: Indolepyruvate oxidoreductase subunit IorB [Candidatus Ozemobacter sibiricus]|jgi:indolepyruvate ferredoxin oxidoreductase beta subunit|uniref:Indolepyruvate oxidoreductase subunit IorB n=1 Tax=Candidatus Ozemobacter sibiricus TaxID=2268124 RepID=A0A367ZJZ2_9BACT|nr:MAG: Indolepyruvate oxidoreductase subunit IorB [Candidatus Ozemobacter sibiricus]